MVNQPQVDQTDRLYEMIKDIQERVTAIQTVQASINARLDNGNAHFRIVDERLLQLENKVHGLDLLNVTIRSEIAQAMTRELCQSKHNHSQEQLKLLLDQEDLRIQGNMKDMVSKREIYIAITGVTIVAALLGKFAGPIAQALGF